MTRSTAPALRYLDGPSDFTVGSTPRLEPGSSAQQQAGPSRPWPRLVAVQAAEGLTADASLPLRHAVADLPLVDLGKVLASQLIVWHHLALYSPMRQVVDPLAPALFGWLADSARLAVQIFLVMAGFLAARSLMPDPARVKAQTWSELPQRLWQRYRRLAPPCLVAIALSLVCAALARCLSDDPAIPALPTWRQLLANLLFMQDIVGEEALSAGLWYVAIDLQLYALMLLLVAVRIALQRAGLALTLATWLMVAGGCACSLLWINRQPGQDIWAGYFFGAYGLGVLASWQGVQTPGVDRRWLVRLLVAGLAIAALGLEWRSRIALAGSVALALMLWPQGRALQRWARQPVLAWLARSSYSIFLVHYGICLLVGAVLQVWSPDSPWLNALGLILAWALSLCAGGLLHRHVERIGRGQAAHRPARPGLVLLAART